MSEDEGDLPRPSGIRAFFKPISVDQAREQHDRTAEKQAVKSAVQSAQDEAFRAEKPAPRGRGRPRKVPDLSQPPAPKKRRETQWTLGGLVLGRAWTGQFIPNKGSPMHFMHWYGVGELPEA